MNKIPVGQTIRFAYAFTFGEIGTVIGLIWIPTVINSVGSFVLFGVLNGVEEGPGGVPIMAGPQLGLMMLYFVVAFFLAAMMAVAVTQQALGLRKGPAFAHFALGGTELRVFGGFFGLYMLFLLFILGFALIGVVAALAGGAAVKASAGAAPLIGSVLGVLGLIASGALVYIFVRLSFLFIPSAVNEGEFGLTRSWELTKGNFWRIFAVGMAVLMPLLLVEAATEFFILGPAYFAAMADQIRDTANAARYAAVQSHIVQTRLPLLLGMGLILAPIMQGLLFAPAAFAYRILSGKVIVQSNNVS